MRNANTRSAWLAIGRCRARAGLVWDCTRFSKQLRCAGGMSDADRTAMTASAHPHGAWRRRASTTASDGAMRGPGFRPMSSTATVETNEVNSSFSVSTARRP